MVNNADSDKAQHIDIAADSVWNMEPVNKYMPKRNQVDIFVAHLKDIQWALELNFLGHFVVYIFLCLNVHCWCLSDMNLSWFLISYVLGAYSKKLQIKTVETEHIILAAPNSVATMLRWKPKVFIFTNIQNT